MRYRIQSVSTSSGCRSSRTKVPSRTSSGVGHNMGANTVPVSVAGELASSRRAGRSSWVIVVSNWIDVPWVRPAS